MNMFLSRFTLNTLIAKNIQSKSNIGCNAYRIIRGVCSTPTENSPDKELLFEHIKSKILLTGPITIATYMKEILTNPQHGYYMNKDVFGTGGDFITSPEITQMFGELISVWMINEMNKLNAPSNKIDIVELGPGRGTMMRDLLRTFHKFKLMDQVNSVCFIEVSNELSKMQGKMLCTPDSIRRNENMLLSKKKKIDQTLDLLSLDETNGNGSNSKAENGKSNNSKDVNYKAVGEEKQEEDLCYQSGTTRNGTLVKWYSSIYDVPQKHFTFFLAHEFFDALPVHKLIKTENGWREILVDFSVNTNELCYVKANNPTPACLFVNKNETRDHIEISPQTAVIVKNIAKRLEEKGGIGLIIDYGHNGEGTDTFRAYCNHEQTDPLKNVGHSDLTADVDFKYIQENVQDKLITYGPITQRQFLKEMHIDVRLNTLTGVCTTDHEIKVLQSAVDMLTDEHQMGSRFKFMSLFPSVCEEFHKKHPVHAFSVEDK
uniref:Protein arginine methyltransferase NDUFAF7 n=1 Tax=Cacopsylla melanoneura TaxID=428564 RepID=A0A8D8ZZ19_9HEMI